MKNWQKNLTDSEKQHLKDLEIETLVLFKKEFKEHVSFCKRNARLMCETCIGISKKLKLK